MEGVGQNEAGGGQPVLTPAQPVGPGALVGTYKVLRMLGRGGMGEVYLARDLQLGRKVALKVVRSAVLGREDARDRFLHEARITARFNHPHIVTIHSVGEHEGNPYVALEYLEGQTLRERLEEERFGQREGMRVALAIAEALAEAHRHDVQHRDLKPGNVLIPRDGRVRVLDFGLARLVKGDEVGRPDPGLLDTLPDTLSGSDISLEETVQQVFQSRGEGLRGTPRYMAPEQWMKQPGTAATDIWALGFMFHELLAGRHPVEGDSFYNYFFEACKPEPLSSLADAAPDLPEPLVKLVDRCLEKNPAARPTADEIVATLSELLEGGKLRRDLKQSPFRGLLPFTERHADLFFGRDEEVGAFLERLRDESVLPVVGPSGAGKSSFVQAGAIPRLREHAAWKVIQLRPGSRPFETLAQRLLGLDSTRKSLTVPAADLSDDLQPVSPGPETDTVAEEADTEKDQDKGKDKDKDKDKDTRKTVSLRGPASENDDAAAAAAAAEPDIAGQARQTGPVDSPAPPRITSGPQPGAVRALAQAIRQSPTRLSLELGQVAEAERCRVLLLVDQLEELYTLVQGEDAEEIRRAFMEALCRAADDPTGPVRAIFTLRDDFLWRLAKGDVAREVLGRVFVLNPPGTDALVETLTRPAALAGYRFEDPDLPKEMVAEVEGEAASLPLLQFAAQRLWERRDDKKKLLTRSAYDDAGGVAGALAHHADSTVAALTGTQERLARSIFVRLVTPESTRKVISRRDLLEGLDPGAEEVLERFTAARAILQRKGRGSTSGGQEQAQLELVHESLIHTWKRLAEWLDESREERVFLTEIGQAAELWEKRGQPTNEVWTGDALVEARRRAARCESIPRPVARFLDAGDQLTRRQSRRRRIMGSGGVVVLAAIALIAVVVAGVLRRKEKETRRQKKIAVKKKLEAEDRHAQALLEGARAAYARGALIEARAKLRTTFEIRDTPLARALWWKLSRQPLRSTFTVGAVAYKAAFSPDGNTVAVASGDFTVHLFDVRTGSERVLRRHNDHVTAIAYAPDGQSIASGSRRGQIRVWDVKTGRHRFVLKGHRGAVWDLCFSADGHTLASASRDKTVRLWDTRKRRASVVLRGHSAGVYGVGFAPDGRLVVSASADSFIRIWQVATGLNHSTLNGHKGVVYAVTFDPTGKLLASAGSDKTIRIWDVRAGTTRVVLSGHQGHVYSVRFSPDGMKLASCGADKTVRIWDAATRRAEKVFREHRQLVDDVDFSPDGRFLVSSSHDKTIKVWDLAAGSEAPEQQGGHGQAVFGIAFSRDGRLLASAGRDHTARVWEVSTGRLVAVLRHPDRVNEVSFDRDGHLLATACNDSLVRLWDINARQVHKVLRGHGSRVYTVNFSSDGRHLASAGSDRKVILWDTATGKPRKVLEGHSAAILAVRFGPDGRSVASGGNDKIVHMWDVATGRQRAMLTGHTARIWGLSFSPDGQVLASASADRTVRLWDLRTGGKPRPRRILGPHPGRVHSPDFDKTGRYLGVPLSDGTARVWDLETGRFVVLRGHRAETNSFLFSPDGKHAATSSDDGTVRVWKTVARIPLWRAPLLLTDPPEIFTHEGWQRLDRTVQTSGVVGRARYRPMETSWRKAVASRARKTSESHGRVCLGTYDGNLEIWETKSDRTLYRGRVGLVEDVLATSDGCLALGQGVARLYLFPTTKAGKNSQGIRPAKVLRRHATAVAVDPDGILIASGQAVYRYTSGGKSHSHLPGGVRVTALARVGKWLALGHKDGGIELVPLKQGEKRPAFSFEDTPASEVVRIISGPKGTLAAGFANGLFGLWSLSDGARLESRHLHGGVVHLLYRGRKLCAVSELGRYQVLDLGVFHLPYCRLMRRVWNEILVGWDRGLPVVRKVPMDHVCSTR